MPIRSVFYSGTSGQDIHLVWGEASRDLTIASLAFAEVLPNGTDSLAFAKTYLANHADVKLEFRPVFKAIDSGATFDGMGIAVNKSTGVVSFTAAAPPAQTRSNFIIEAVVTQNTGGIDPALIVPTLIRVHVHPGVRRVWMTPKRLLVRRLAAAGAEETTSRFTVRAEFTDDTVGDITVRHNVISTPAANVVAAGDNGGRLKIAEDDAVGATIPITATWKTFSDTADMVIGAPWASEAAPPQLELVEGHPDTWRGTINPERVPNVLILGDGLTPPDLPALATIANTIVHSVKTDAITRPYDRLATSMNFWRVAVPATDRGVSVRCEVYTSATDGHATAKPVPPAVAPVAGRPWDVAALNYMAGLPTPADAPAHKTVAALRAEWAATMRPLPAINAADAVIEEWQEKSTRTFIDEIDGFPAMAVGAPPTARESSKTPLLSLHPERGGERGLPPFFRVLAAKNGVAITGPAGANQLGIVWAEDRPSFRVDNRPLVVITGAIKAGRAARTPAPLPHIALSLAGGNHPIPVKAAGGGRRALTFNFTGPLPDADAAGAWRTIAHELGHSFGLGDEYVDLPGGYTAPESALDTYANLTTQAAVSTGGAIDAAKIKWTWHRARNAGVVSGAITPSGGNLRVPLYDAAGFRFAVGDPVFLRQRPSRTVIGRKPVTSVPLHVAAPRDPTGDSVLVSGTLGVPPATFGEGSTLYVAVPDPDTAGAFLGLIAPKIAKFMKDNHRALTKWPCDPLDQSGVDAENNPLGTATQVPEYDGYDGVWSHRNDVRTIGLYSGGAQIGCGIFHPAGQCMMRNPNLAVNQFCHVCRFVLVEMINATAHAWIDQEYDRIYPK